MLVRVDDVKSIPTQWGYTNEDGDLELVEFDGNLVVHLSSSDQTMSVVYTSDIPNLIKALQAAYNFSQEKNIAK